MEIESKKPTPVCATAGKVLQDGQTVNMGGSILSGEMRQRPYQGDMSAGQGEEYYKI